jgi:hypothetical protein
MNAEFSRQKKTQASSSNVFRHPVVQASRLRRTTETVVLPTKIENISSSLLKTESILGLFVLRFSNVPVALVAA